MSKRLVETIREGAIPDVVRRKACRGELPVSLEEKIEILVVLAADRNEETRHAAFHSLENWPLEELQQVLANPFTSAAVLEFVTLNLAPGCKELEDALLQNSILPDDLREWLESVAALFAEAASSEPSNPPLPIPVVSEEGTSEGDAPEQRRETLLQKINRLSAAERIKTALMGNQEQRLILIHDPNKLVTRAVLQSPKLSEHEVENIASMKNVTEDVLRLIAMNRKFKKNYAVVHALVTNPRTPIDVGLPLVKHLNERDMKWLVLDRNVADVIRITAEKIIRRKEEANKPKSYGKH